MVTGEGTSDGYYEPTTRVATIRTTEASDVSVHDCFDELRIKGEWYQLTEEIRCLINEIRSKRITTVDSVVGFRSSFVADRSSYVATTTDTEQIQHRTDTDKDQRESALSEDSYQIPSKTCPEDFEPNPIAERQVLPRVLPGVDRDRELIKFKLHEFQYQRLDWDRAWGKWLMNAKPENTNESTDGRNKLQQRTDELFSRSTEPES